MLEYFKSLDPFQTKILIAQIILGLLIFRSLLFWLQQWQMRQYRYDRLMDHLKNTVEGRSKIWKLWFFKGILPRPKLSGRILLCFAVSILFLAGFNVLLYTLLQDPQIYNDCFFRPDKLYPGACVLQGSYLDIFTFFITALATADLVSLAVLMVNPLVKMVQKRTFQKAYDVISHADPSIVRIAISGSFGKSSTKEILVHLLKDAYGEENVLYNPENQNNEVAIAKLLTRRKDFFIPNVPEVPKVLVIETGAYKKGEVDLIGSIVRPHYSIITGLNNQHLSLFGSEENIQIAETELVEHTSAQVYHNGDNPMLQEALKKLNKKSVLKKVSKSFAHNIHTELRETLFEWEKTEFNLPWPGEFFVINALQALEVAKALKISPKDAAKSLENLAPLKRALHIERYEEDGYWILNDPYSANPDGVLAAIKHLSLVEGRKVLVAIPLVELGSKAKEEHERIFQALKKHNVEVFWLKKDYAKLGKEILGDLWHGNDPKKLKEVLAELSDGDGVLLESRVSI